MSVRELPLKEAAARVAPAHRSRYALACLYAFDAEWNAARQCAEDVQGSRKPVLLELIELWRAQHARTLIRQAEAAMAAGREEKAHPVLTALRESYSDIGTVKDKLAWIDAMISKCAEKQRRTPRAEKSPYRLCGRCMGTGRITVKKKRFHPMGDGAGHWEYYTGLKQCPVCKGKRKILRQTKR